MKETIEKFYCDNCKQDVASSGDFGSHIRISFQGLTYTGDRGGYTTYYDLCNNCTHKVRELFNNNLGIHK